ncbi:hypothetical protein IGI04_000131 [Brassica rapa subsp. trilocularis]|uniref:Uncharacterized protein n=1 Tax=Brassica rapa subsp. trilocularis TaxID=1813537 RepID=A0ABQ7NNV9_BRACM|nr:hypothetical protein IGI04_000131 [Brassica rapa subsp. trilocularis]
MALDGGTLRLNGLLRSFKVSPPSRSKHQPSLKPKDAQAKKDEHRASSKQDSQMVNNVLHTKANIIIRFKSVLVLGGNCDNMRVKKGETSREEEQVLKAKRDS